MGQAKNRGTREERIAEAQKRNPTQSGAHLALSQAEAMQLLSKARPLDPLINALTTPKSIDDKVIQFAKQIGGKEPMLLNCEPEPWSRQSCCDMNVSRYIQLNGGRMLSGYRIWYAEPRYIEGERHAVWTDGTAIRDVSFVDTGETSVVFVPDELEFDDAPPKVRFAFEERDKQALAAHERIMNAMPITKMPDDEAWSTYPTYEDWVAGKRMSNIIPKAVF